MDTPIDFVQSLQSDLAFSILACLDDPADLARASCVSRSWHQFVISNGLCKKLCMRKFSQLSSVARIIKPDCGSGDVASGGSTESEVHESNHDAYASLLEAVSKPVVSPTECIGKAISASSTDIYPDESIINTLNPRYRFLNGASYWSSTGQNDPDVPETLIYQLTANLCIVTEIKIRPFEAFFQPGGPIYSAKAVRFRMGHPKSLRELERDLVNIPFQQAADDKFVWTYTSQEFPMAQRNQLQQFKLPEPVLCFGGFLQVELLGRIQRQEMDGLLYICVAHVQVLGRPLSPAFDVELIEPSRQFLLKYYPKAFQCTMQSRPSNEEVGLVEELWVEGGLLEYLVGGNQLGVGPLNLEDDDDEEENELDEMVIL